MKSWLSNVSPSKRTTACDIGDGDFFSFFFSVCSSGLNIGMGYWKQETLQIYTNCFSPYALMVRPCTLF